MLVNFPAFWKMCLDMIEAGSGYRVNRVIVSITTEISEASEVTDVVDVTILPKVLGGTKVSKRDGGEEDETYTHGVEHPSMWALLTDLASAQA